jgi:hypothetical protein
MISLISAELLIKMFIKTLFLYLAAAPSSITPAQLR